MASINLVDYDSIVDAYDSIVHGDNDWMLLHYSDPSQPEDISLAATGSHGLGEMKREMEDLREIHIMFHKEPQAGYVLIIYIPEGMSGVRRARALVHARRVGAVFTVDYATLTVDHIGNITPNAIHQAIVQASAPAPTKEINTSPPPIKRAFSFEDIPDLPPPPMPKSSILPSFLRRKNKILEEEDDAAPPPTPPKDSRSHTISIHPSEPAVLPRPRAATLSEFGQIHISQSDEDEEEDGVLVERPSPISKSSSLFIIPVDRKWTIEQVSNTSDPEERARRRILAQRQRQLEEEKAIQEEKDRQLRLKLHKEEQKKQEAREEAARKLALEREIKHIQAERRRKERLEREEEDMRKAELEAKRKAERDRRMLEHEKLEAWRREQAKVAQDAAKKEEENLRRQQEEKRKKVLEMEARVKKTAKDEEGWLTIQTSDSLIWRRRYYKIVGNTAFFYRSPKDTTVALDQLGLLGNVSALREWHEGYEELKAIPFSFAIEFKDKRGAWSIFTDSEEDKFKLLGLIHFAAGLRS